MISIRSRFRGDCITSTIACIESPRKSGVWFFNSPDRTLHFVHQDAPDHLAGGVFVARKKSGQILRIAPNDALVVIDA